jgi:hypothetical protein
MRRQIKQSKARAKFVFLSIYKILAITASPRRAGCRQLFTHVPKF